MRENRDIYLEQFSTASARTVFVACGNVLDGPAFMVADTTNAENFMHFMRQI